jgi:predicted enzyme involved in methoxymalonyl-ACP biosynthesis
MGKKEKTETIKIGILAKSNVELFAMDLQKFLAKNIQHITFDIYTVPYGQYRQELININSRSPLGFDSLAFRRLFSLRTQAVKIHR